MAHAFQRAANKLARLNFMFKLFALTAGLLSCKQRAFNNDISSRSVALQRDASKPDLAKSETSKADSLKNMKVATCTHSVTGVETLTLEALLSAEEAVVSLSGRSAKSKFSFDSRVDAFHQPTEKFAEFILKARQQGSMADEPEKASLVAVELRKEVKIRGRISNSVALVFENSEEVFEPCEFTQRWH